MVAVALFAGSLAGATPAGPFAFVPPHAEPGRSPSEVVASLLESKLHRRGERDVRVVEALWYVPQRSSMPDSPCPAPSFAPAWVALAHGRFSVSSPPGPRAWRSEFDRACIHLGDAAFAIRPAPGAEVRQWLAGRRVTGGR